MHDIMIKAMEAARIAGAEYVDVRVFRNRFQTIGTSDLRVQHISDNEVYGVGIRVLVDGCWGFSGTHRVDYQSMLALARKAVSVARSGIMLRGNGGVTLAAGNPTRGQYQTPIEIDPFTVSLDEKTGLLLAVAERLARNPEIKKSYGFMNFSRTERDIVSSDGVDINDVSYRTFVSYTAVAVGNGDARTRTFFWPPLSKGYELIKEAPLVEEADRVAAEAVELLHARECPEMTTDLILDPSHLALTIHESVGHATELDRVLGMEESLAGRSFATTEKLGRFAYGSPLINFMADNTLPFGLATMGWDDDGIPATKWHVIKDGILSGYATNREVAPLIGETESKGCNRADHWGSIPIVRIPNLILMPGKKPLSPEQLIADTDEGVYIEGTGSFSIDQMRLNFQFGGDVAWLIKHGKRQHMLKNVIYQSITPQFWGSCDAICDERYWRPFGVMNCGKGDPMQVAVMTHGAATARFRGIKVGGVRP